MNNTQYNTPPTEFFGGLQRWLEETAGTNAETLARLTRHLPRAIREELTPQQQKCLQMRYFDRKTMQEIGEELGVDKSTVSKTLARAEKNLYRVLRYCL